MKFLKQWNLNSTLVSFTIGLLAWCTHMELARLDAIEAGNVVRDKTDAQRDTQIALLQSSETRVEKSVDALESRCMSMEQVRGMLNEYLHRMPVSEWNHAGERLEHKGP